MGVLAMTVGAIILALWQVPNAAAQTTVTLLPSFLNFPPTLVGTTSAAQTSTLTNTGSQPLTITSITAAGLFKQTNNCPASPMTIPPGGTCTFTVSFQPGAGGPAAGLISVTDNVLPAQVISLGGNGEDFSLAISPASATVAAGQSATFTMTAAPQGGFNLPVTFSCGDLPAGASCSFSPNPVTLDGTNPVQVTVTVATTARALGVPGHWPDGVSPNGWAQHSARWLWAFLIGLGGLVAVRSRRLGLRMTSTALALLLLAVLGIAACGGGGGGGGGTSGTPAGSYSLLVTGSASAGSANLQNPVSMTLVVQ